jgi:hypothetical protein
MNENETNFESLRRLLALKRHEMPPPGYFDNFSREVTARIRAGEMGGTADTSKQLSWLFRLLSALEAKPAFTGPFASALCMLLLFGIVFAERPDTTTQPLLTPMAQADPGMRPLAAISPLDLNAQSAVVQPADIPINSTNPVFNVQPASMIFGQSSATVQPLTFSLGN